MTATQEQLDRVATIAAFYKTHGAAWAVIEMAGYEGENERAPLFATYADADAWAGRKYGADEREELHVDIAHWSADGCEPNGGFWSYDH